MPWAHRELLNLAKKDRALKSELDRQRAKEQTVQLEKAYERQFGTGSDTVTEGAILTRLRSVERTVRPDLSVLDRDAPAIGLFEPSFKHVRGVGTHKRPAR